MNGKILYKEINHIGNDLIVEASNASSVKEEKKLVSISWKRWTSIAACLCLILFSIVILPLMQKDSNVQLPDSTRIFADDIVSRANGTLIMGGGTTKAYFTMVAEKLSNIMRSPVKDNTSTPSLRVYQSVNIDDTEAYFTKKIQRITENAKKYLGLSLTTQNYTSYDDFSSYWIDLMSQNFKINTETSNNFGTTVTNYRIWNSDGPLQCLELFGKEISVTADESDTSIQNKLSDALTFANKIFQSDCKIQSISRNNEYSEDGNITFYVDAYEISSDINQLMYNQYLGSMRFLFMNDNDDNDIRLIGIYYTEYELENAFPELVELISVKEAETYLESGYIFSGHVCPGCMGHNSEVDFTHYDGIEIVYKTSAFGKYVIPFYAFYKQTGEYTYAVAYVPAVAVGGLKEYFESQESWHNTDN